MAKNDPSPSGGENQSQALDEAASAKEAAATARQELPFRLLFERAGVGMTEIDREWRIVRANPVYCAIAGRNESELVGQSCLAFTAPEDLEKSRAALRSLASPGANSVSFEKRYIRPDGAIVWIRSNLARIEQPDGTDRFLKIVEDIAGRKAAEERQAALVELGDRFRELEDPADLAYAAAQILGRTLGISRAGYGTIDPVAETVSIERDWNAPGIESLAGVLHFRDYGSYIEDLKRGETVVFADAEKDPRTAANADALKAISAQAVVNMPITEQGGFVALLYLNHATAREWTPEEMDFIRDVAQRTRTVVERRRVEERLREEGHNLEILNSVGSALSGELDLERLVQMATDAGVDLTGARFGAFFYNVEREDGEAYMLYTLSGAERSDFERFGMPRNTKIFAPTFDGDGIVRSDDITADPRYGQNPPHKGMPEGHLPVRSYLAVPVKGRTGGVIGGLFFGHPEPGQFKERHERLMTGIAAQAAVAIDNARLFREAQREIEHRMKAERALTALNETLETRVRDEIDRRAIAEEALRQAQKMETVGQLSGGIAHDFNNLLQIVHGNLTLLQQSLPRDEAKWQRAVRNAITGAERAASLTRRLLAFSRRQPLAPRAVDLNRLVADMSELLRRTLGETIRVDMDLSPGFAVADVDPNQLENSILNLAINARDAMAEGGVLSIATAAAEIGEDFLRLHPDAVPGDYVRLTVSDTGEGMNPETVARAVEPFFTTKEVGRGTGLGLSMVYGFVRQSDGYLDIRSEVGRGTSIDIYLPRATGEVEVEQEPERAELSRGAGETVLLCEDDEDVRRFSAESLRELGYQVVEAADADSAIERLRDVAPVDLLFTDVVLPGGKNGADLAREAREVQPGLKVLFTTGYARSALDDTAIEGGVEVLPKPFSVQELAQRLRQMLG